MGHVPPCVSLERVVGTGLSEAGVGELLAYRYVKAAAGVQTGDREGVTTVGPLLCCPSPGSFYLQQEQRQLLLQGALCDGGLGFVQRIPGEPSGSLPSGGRTQLSGTWSQPGEIVGLWWGGWGWGACPPGLDSWVNLPLKGACLQTPATAEPPDSDETLGTRKLTWGWSGALAVLGDFIAAKPPAAGPLNFQLRATHWLSPHITGPGRLCEIMQETTEVALRQQGLLQ